MDDHQIEKKIEEPFAFKTFGVGERSTGGVNGKFCYSELLIDCLLKLQFNKKDQDELIQFLKQQYHDNRIELENINQFEKKYEPNKAIQWYTKECFFYKTLNLALRTEDIHLMFLYHSYIADIQQQLQKYQSNQILHVYRAQIISKDELQKLKGSVGQFISINSFFSTTIQYSKALSFFNRSKSTGNTEKVLFQIKANPHVVTTKPFANITQLSWYSKEEEVLFMIGSIFRVEAIVFDAKNQVSIIEMILSSDDENESEQVLNHMKNEIDSKQTNLRNLAKILSEMGQFNLARKYLERQLNELLSSPNDPLIGHIYHDLGTVASQSGNLDESMDWHKKSFEFKQKNSAYSVLEKNNKHLPKQSSLFASIRQKISRKSSKQESHLIKWDPNAVTVAGGNGQGDKLNQLCRPEGIYVDDRQRTIFIADCWNHRIVKWKFDRDCGQIVAGGNDQGDRIDQLNSPTDVIVDQKTKSLIICDYGNRRVVRWSITDQLDREIIISDIRCYGLVMNTNGDLFVCDEEKNVVKRWSDGGKGEATIVAGGNGKGDQLDQLKSPTFIFIDHNDTLYVSDFGNNRVMKWAKDAKAGVVVVGGQSQEENYKRYYPMGVVVNELGDVCVADCFHHEITCWSSGSKQSRLVLGGYGKGQESSQLNCPHGLSFDGMNNLYVVDESNHRIQRFDIIRN